MKIKITKHTQKKFTLVSYRIKYVINVSHCHDYNLYSIKGKLSSKNCKLSSKIIIKFRFVQENVLHTMGTLKSY